MRLPQLRRPLQAAIINGGHRPFLTAFTVPIRPAIPAPAPIAEGNGGVESRRHASVKAQGAYRIPNKKTIGKKLGAKKSGDQYVIPGNIIFKQRGTIWHPGENTIRGRDHTIHAAVAGYVKYYRDPALHPNRQYIGVAFNKEDTLPYPKKEPRRRKLGMVAHVRKTRQEEWSELSPSGLPKRVVRPGGLYDIAELRSRLWTREKMRELVAAREREKAEAKAADGAAATAPAAGAAPAAAAASSANEDSEGKKKKKTSKQKLRFVMPQEFLTKRWMERRRTKVLRLNPQSYAYTETNAAIGRLASRTMYTPPWKLGGRKSRFRAKRRRRVQKLRRMQADKEFVRAEKAKEKIAEEAARLAKLEKQRAKGIARARKAEADSQAANEGPAKEDTAKEGAAEQVKAVEPQKPEA